MFDYGNARIAALRSRLLDPPYLLRLENSGDAAGFLALLERAEDWRHLGTRSAPPAAQATVSVGLAIERHRSARLGGLPRWYPAPARALVEALVMPLDLERLVSVLRRRRAGEDPDRVAAGVVGGALLDVPALIAIARAPGAAAAIEVAVRARLLERSDASSARAVLERDGWSAFEAAVVSGIQRSRLTRAAGRGRDPEAVQAVLAGETEVRARVLEELRAGGMAAAAAVEREATLARLDALAAAGPRDPLGVGAAAGYVGAIEAQAIRLRAALARATGGWPERVAVAYHAARGRH